MKVKPIKKLFVKTVPGGLIRHPNSRIALEDKGEWVKDST